MLFSTRVCFLAQLNKCSGCSFSWEEVSVHGRSSGGGFRLLAVEDQWDLKLLEAEAERSVSISLVSACECPAHRLLQAIREQDQGEYPHHHCCHGGLKRHARRPLSRPPSLIVLSFPGVCELQSVQLLSFVAGRCCLLLNGDWLLQLQWQQTEAELQTASCCRIQLAGGSEPSAVHHVVCAETLFVLHSTGLICIRNKCSRTNTEHDTGGGAEPFATQSIT